MNKFEGMLLACDMDGTLLDSSRRISERNERALRYFTEEGGRFSLATGRAPGAVSYTHLDLEATMPKIELRAVAEEDEVPQMTMDSLSGNAVAERLRALQVDTMTPIEALNALYELKKLV